MQNYRSLAAIIYVTGTETEATQPRPKAIIAKSICDFADSRKSDIYQKFAAYTSCEFVKLMLEEIL